MTNLTENHAGITQEQIDFIKAVMDCYHMNYTLTTQTMNIDPSGMDDTMAPHLILECRNTDMKYVFHSSDDIDISGTLAAILRDADRIPGALVRAMEMILDDETDIQPVIVNGMQTVTCAGFFIEPSTKAVYISGNIFTQTHYWDDFYIIEPHVAGLDDDALRARLIERTNVFGQKQ